MVETNQILKQAGILFVTGMLSGSLIWAQTLGSNSNQGDIERLASIQGFIVQSGTGEPLGKARVMLRPVEGREPVFGAVTEADGRFLLANITAGNYRLHIERDGYVDQQYGQVSSNRPGTVLVLMAGQQVQDVIVSLVPTGTISGRVYDADGEPIVGANVRAFRYQYSPEGRVLAPVRQTETNDLGEYRLYWLTPGEYVVSAAFQARYRAAAALRESVLAGTPPVVAGRAGFPPAVVRPDPTDEVYVDTYYPGTNDPVNASPLTVLPATEVGAVDFTVLPTRAAILRGTVVGPFSDQDTHATVAIVPRNSVVAPGRFAFRRGGRNGRGGAGVNSDGTFELVGVAPGAYTMVALVRPQGRGGGAGILGAGLLDIEVGGDMSDLLIAIQPTVSVRGRVLVNQGAGDVNVSRLRVRLQTAENLPVGSPNARVGAEGTFAIDNAMQTVHRIVLTGLPDGAYVASADIGGRDVLVDGIRVTAEMEPIEFRINGDGGTVDGTVQITRNQTYTGAQVVLIPRNTQRDDLYKVASTDQYGRFGLQGIAPGSYRIFAWEDAPAGAFRDPEFIRSYEHFGEPIEIEPSERVLAQPQLIPAVP